MLEKEAEITKELICPKCKFIFKDPRLIECGVTYCQLCVLGMTSDKTLKCESCKKGHKLPDSSGFPIDQMTLKLIQQRTGESRFSKELNECRSKIETELALLENNNLRPCDRIEEHCYEVRNKVDLAAETLILAVNNYRDECLARINEYKEKCIKNIQSDLVRTETLNEWIYENKEFLKTWNEYLRGFKSEENKLKTAIETSNKILSQIRTKSKKLDMFIFNNTSMDFVDSNHEFKNEKLGKIVFKKLTGSNNKIDLKKAIPEDSVWASIEILDDMCFIFTRKNNVNLSKFIYFLDGNLFSCDESFANNVKQHVSCACPKFVYVLIHSISTTLIALDKMGDITSCREVDSNALQICSNESAVHVFFKDKIEFYNKTLNSCLKTVSFNSNHLWPNGRFVRPKLNGNNIFVFDENRNRISVVDISSAKPLDGFQVRGGPSFMIYGDELFIVDIETQELVVYSLETISGEIKRTLKLNTETPVSHVYLGRDFFYLFDSVNRKMY